MKPKDLLGRQGEQLAADFLVTSGMEILERNWRCPCEVMRSVRVSKGPVSQVSLRGARPQTN